MNKKLIIVIWLIVVVGAVSFAVLSRDNGSSLTDEQIRKKFGCDRLTLDIRSTDVYCDNTDLYRQHVRENKVIDHPHTLED